MSAITRFVPYFAGGLALAACCVTAGCSGTAEAAPVAQGGPATSAAAASASPSASASASAPASPSAAPSSAAASPSAAPSTAAAKPSPVVTTRSSPAAESISQADPIAAEDAALKAAGVPCDATAVACVSLSKQEAWLLHDGKVVYGPVPVATGRASLPTPTGNFHVFLKQVDGWSRTYNAPMPFSVYFYEGDAFHQDPVNVRSHGCVHLTYKDAKYFYNFLQYGDKVEVRN